MVVPPEGVAASAGAGRRGASGAKGLRDGTGARIMLLEASAESTVGEADGAG
jgi:hypothetical protein